MAAAQTESIVGDFIGALIRADNIETLALYAHMTGPLKNHVARALLELNAANAAVVDDVDDLLEAIEDALAKRNTLVHSPLIRHPDTGEIFSHRLKARGCLQLKLVPILVEEIEQDAALIYETGLALAQFMTLYGIRPANRPFPLREDLDRSKKARQERRNVPVGDGGESAA